VKSVYDTLEDGKTAVEPVSETVPELFMNPASCHDFPSPSPSPEGRGYLKIGSPCLPLPSGEGRGEGDNKSGDP